jgi:hypothetical protein
MEKVDRAVSSFKKGFNYSQSVLSAYSTLTQELRLRSKWKKVLEI